MIYVVYIVGGPDDGRTARSDSELASDRILVQRLLGNLLLGDRVTSSLEQSLHGSVGMVTRRASNIGLSRYQVVCCSQTDYEVRLTFKYVGWNA
ncbi:MAG: hypothetical protein SGJ20_04215 [Planctomycetota bacterium]|nr:hypothetical protein [Planctomycetota bacterium]